MSRVVEDIVSSRRYAGIIVGGIGLCLAAVHAVHFVAHDKPLLATIIGVVVPLSLSLVVVYGGYWITRQEYPLAYVTRLVGWTIAGGVAMGLVVGTIGAHQYLTGHFPEDAGFQLATAVTGGTLGGILLGIYDMRVQRRSDRIETLQAATGQFVEATSKAEVCEQVVRLIATELRLPLAGAWLYDDSARTLEPIAISESGRETFDEYPTYEESDDSLSWQVFTDGELRVYGDLSDHADRHNPETVVRSEIVVPLGTHGVLNIGSEKPKAFDDVDVSTIRLLATATSAVLDRVEREQQLRAQQRELEAKNERLDEFASIVSHDLRNPLNIASGHLELLEAECDDPSIDEIGSAHDRIESLITDLLHLARAGQAVEETSELSLERVAESAWEMVATGEATVEYRLNDRLIAADESRLRQLLENLFRNAIEHSGEPPTVRVGELEDWDGFYVADDGPGIPTEDRERVFELGYTTHEEGTGFGLATVSRIAEGHGWSVSVTESVDGGARFEIVL